MSEETYIKLTSLMYELVRVCVDDPEPDDLTTNVLGVIEGASRDIDAHTAARFID